MAWLNTAPKDKPEGKKNEARRVIYEEKHGAPLDMPECDALHVVEYLLDIGPVLHGGMGASPLTYEEIAAWEHLAGIELTVWEAQMVRRLSLEYLSEQQRAESSTASPPWQDAPYLRDAPAVKPKSLMDYFGEMKK